MVSFRLEPDEQKFIERLERFLETEIEPHHEKYRVRARKESQIFQPDSTIAPDLLQLSRDIRRKSAAEGFYAAHLPKEVGGQGLRKVALVEANRTVFRHGLGLTLTVLASIEGPSQMLLALPEEQREKYLYPMIRGEKTSCFALTEPGAGSDVKAIQTTAVLEGDEWVLNGEKVFITNGPYADFACVFAKTSDDEMGGISAFVVPKGTPGFRVVETMETIANNGLPAHFEFKDCRIPKENIIGEPGEGWWHALSNINDIRMQLGGQCIGLSEFCLDKTVQYVTERKAFGKPVSKFQGVSFPLADCKTEITAARTLALYAAWLIDENEQAIMETSMTKLYCSEVLWNVADRCVQAMGGQGVLRENEIERILRWARVMRIWEGSSEIQRMTIAKTMGL
ncbi:MAG TPA: acyl-CoA dehydrogenase family protein [Candidatus Thermoplasmatota archaeon]|nr:acyl-CoA dehydrogenase family protein [Candidatus Thermoplasmatota archaeon]